MNNKKNALYGVVNQIAMYVCTATFLLGLCAVIVEVVNKVSAAGIAVTVLVFAGAIVTDNIVIQILRTKVFGMIVIMEENMKVIASGDLRGVSEWPKDSISDMFATLSKFQNGLINVAETMEKVAAGDMSVKVTPLSDKDILAKALNNLIDNNNSLLTNIKEATNQVAIGSGQVSDASTNLASGSTEQASALEQVSVSIDEIAQHTKKNADMANESAAKVHQIKEKAEIGDNQMKDMIAAMDDINTSSENISKIIKVIDDIAFQTNILALNAAVEAARAGAHGKGFSVVAEEVRTLAAKSAAAAAETAEMIEDSIRKVNLGSKMAKDTGEILDEITSSVVDIVTNIDQIAEASNEQATAVTQIDKAINQVSQVVQNNSATSEQCAAASEELSNQAANLRGLVDQYRLNSSIPTFSMNSAPAVKNFTSSTSSANEKIISLDGDFGKY